MLTKSAEPASSLNCIGNDYLGNLPFFVGGRPDISAIYHCCSLLFVAKTLVGSAFLL